MLAQCLSRSWVGFLAPLHPESFPSSWGPRGCAGPHCPRQTPWVPTQEEKQEGQGRPASCYSIQKGCPWVRGQGRDAPRGRSMFVQHPARPAWK